MSSKIAIIDFFYFAVFSVPDVLVPLFRLDQDRRESGKIFYVCTCKKELDKKLKKVKCKSDNHFNIRFFFCIHSHNRHRHPQWYIPAQILIRRQHRSWHSPKHTWQGLGQKAPVHALVYRYRIS